jgi:hypothetical protein
VDHIFLKPRDADLRRLFPLDQRKSALALATGANAGVCVQIKFEVNHVVCNNHLDRMPHFSSKSHPYKIEFSARLTVMGVL